MGPQMMAGNKLLIGNKELDAYSKLTNISVDGKTSGTIDWEPGFRRLTFTNVTMNISSYNLVTFEGDIMSLVFVGTSWPENSSDKQRIKTNYTDLTDFFVSLEYQIVAVGIQREAVADSFV